MSANPLRAWRTRSQRFGLGAATVAVTTLLGLLRTKWLALHLGAEGVGLVGMATATWTWFGLLAGLGMNVALAQGIAAARGAGDAHAEARDAVTAARLVAIASAVVALVLLVAAGPLAALLLASAEHATLIRIAALGVAGFGLQAYLQGVFAGRSDLGSPFAYALGGGLVMLAFTLWLVPAQGIEGAAFAGTMLFPAGAATAMAVMALRRPAHVAASFDSARARALLAVGITTLSVSLLDQGVVLATRSQFLAREGAAANGYFQAAIALSQQVGAVFYVYLASYAFGQVSARGGVAAMEAYTRRQWKPLLALATLAFTIAQLASPWLLHVIYSDRFDGARPMIAWTLAGEFGRVAMQAWALASLPAGGPRLWMPLMLSFPLVFFAGALAASALGAGPLSLAFGYASAGAVSLLCVGFGMSRAKVRLGPGNLLLLLAAVAWQLVLALRFGR